MATSRHSPIAVAFAMSGPHRFAAVVHLRDRRHRHADVLAHELRRGRPVAALVRGDEALQEPLLVLAELGALGVVLRQPLAQRRPRTLQRAVGRRRRSGRGSPPSRPPTTPARRAGRAPRAGAPAGAGSRRCRSARSSRARRRRRPAPPRSARPRRAAGPGRAAATGPRPATGARRFFARSESRHTLVAILYSHARRPSPPAKLSRAFHARRNASCSASSASSKEPSIR